MRGEGAAIEPLLPRSSSVLNSTVRIAYVLLLDFLARTRVSRLGLWTKSSFFEAGFGLLLFAGFFSFVPLALFSEKNFPLGSPQSHDSRLAGPP